MLEGSIYGSYSPGWSLNVLPDLWPERILWKGDDGKSREGWNAFDQAMLEESELAGAPARVAFPWETEEEAEGGWICEICGGPGDEQWHNCLAYPGEHEERIGW